MVDELHRGSLHVLSNEIREEAKRLGFQKVGFAKAERLDEEAGHLQEWLERGYHGTMHWMARGVEKRLDVRNVLPGARSVVVVALNYYVDVQHSDGEGIGKISRYAWGNDYHDIVSERLGHLLDFIRVREPSAHGRLYVDTGPVMEKVWAQRAGIGWEGKHTNVITQEFGSWIFVGDILLDIDLEYDAPTTDHCGSCTLCIEACPTGAIVQPYVLDSNRCISYLTIEHRGAIAEELGAKFDSWIYGCDICQDVCPWNRKFSSPTEVNEFRPRERNIAPKLASVLGMTQTEFDARFRGSPIKRTKLEGLARNAQVACVTATIENKEHKHG